MKKLIEEWQHKGGFNVKQIMTDLATGKIEIMQSDVALRTVRELQQQHFSLATVAKVMLASKKLCTIDKMYYDNMNQAEEKLQKYWLGVEKYILRASDTLPNMTIVQIDIKEIWKKYTDALDNKEKKSKKKK